MRSFAISLLSVALICGANQSAAQWETPSYMVSVPLSITVSGDQLIMNAIVQDAQGTLDYRVYQRERNSGDDWGNHTTVTTWPYILTLDEGDHKIYEFKVIRRNNGSAPVGFGYICAGRESPASEWSRSNDHYMGKIVVLVEENLHNLIEDDIEVLTADLRADGWNPVKKIVNANQDHNTSKTEILMENSVESVKAVLIIGSVKSPKVHNRQIDPDGHAPDGQPDYFYMADRLWAADGYYGDFDGTWPAWSGNMPPEGLPDFDLLMMPNIEAAVGRIDFSNMTGTGAFTYNEAELTAAYIQRLRAFKRRDFIPVPRGIVFDGLLSNTINYSSILPFGGYSSMFPLVGNSVHHLPPNSSFPNDGVLQPDVNANGYEQFAPYINLVGGLINQNGGSFLWTFSSGTGINDAGLNFGGTTAQYSNPNFQHGGVFNMLVSSYTMRWNKPYSVLRARIASGHGLTSVWSGNPHWFFHNMGMGEPISRGILQSMNNSNQSDYGYEPYYSWDPSYAEYGGVYPPSDYANVHMALMGDPTLRMHYVAPPTALVLEDVSGMAELAWQPSAETVAGYHIYHFNGNGEPVLLNQTPVPSTTYLTSIPFNEQDEYMVRATKLENTPSGSYWNLSIGAIKKSCVFTLDATEHQILQNETWSTDRNVRGEVIVENGVTLTIDGATIRFAPSNGNNVTNITVKPGGVLHLLNGAELTSIGTDCGPPSMWNGVKVLGNGTTTGAGLVIMESGARITNALTALRCANGDPTIIFGGDASSGGIIQATDGIFENNFLDVVTRPHADIDPVAWGPSYFTNCSFRRNAELNDPQLPPGSRVNLMGSAAVQFTNCVFENTSGIGSSEHWGMGIHAINTKISVVGGDTQAERGKFTGLSLAVLHSTFDPTRYVVIDKCDFQGNSRGALLAGSNSSQLIRSTFEVADVSVSELGVEGAYGAYLHGCSGFEFEENVFTAIGTAHPKVGAVFRNTGTEDNMFRNNTFNAFTDAAGRSAGTIIMGTNAVSDASTGLRIKCNDYSSSSINDFDVAFTGSNVLIAYQQGSTGENTEHPAGNTFANVDELTCNGNDEQHFYVQNVVNAFGYWHHQPQTAVELVPHCSSASNTNTNTEWPYSKPVSCPVEYSGLVGIGNDVTTAGNAQSQFTVLKEVYGNWRDGGNTEGLGDFVRNPANDSYAVRNQLMLVAPKVSSDIWRLVFDRTPAMNPWHLAQALIANSPLEPIVLRMMDQYDIDEFYRQLVRDNQDGSISMHSIYKSEIAHFYSVKAVALQDILRKSLNGSSQDRALAQQSLQDNPIRTISAARFAIHLANNDLVNARGLVTAELAGNGEDKDYWVVQDLWLQLLELNKSELEIDANGVAELQRISGSDGMGSAQAQAWLSLLGQATQELVILPGRAKSLREDQTTNRLSMKPLLSAYPNPSNGPVYLVYAMPVGVEDAEIRLHDVQGRLVKQQRLPSRNGVLEVQPKETSTGMHVASMYFDGILVGTAKVSIVR